MSRQDNVQGKLHALWIHVACEALLTGGFKRTIDRAWKRLTNGDVADSRPVVCLIQMDEVFV
jgi:hypothetical protein